MNGLTESQVNSLNSYDNLLYELGEKNSFSYTKKWPVEVRLLGYMAFNGLIFYAQKQLLSGNGEGFGKMMEMFAKIKGKTSQSASSNSQQFQQPSTTKMKGPTIKPEDINNQYFKKTS
jgi:hypothetical protein